MSDFQNYTSMKRHFSRQELAFWTKQWGRCFALTLRQSLRGISVFQTDSNFGLNKKHSESYVFAIQY